MCLQYGAIFVADTVVATAALAGLQLRRLYFLRRCEVDVLGVCETSSLPASCFPVGLVVAFLALWVANVVLWAWATWLMMAHNENDRLSNNQLRRRRRRC